MIRTCTRNDLSTIYEIINDASSAYKGIIPADRWKEPYMTMEELNEQISDGVEFWGYESDGKLIGVMGIQDKKEVCLIRHAYVRTSSRKNGIGTDLLKHLVSKSEKPILIGTWKDAVWAISFYVKNGFSLVTDEEKTVLLKRFWKIPQRQVETSVALADKRWIERKSM